MAASKLKHPLGSPQELIEMCKTHDLAIDMFCEDCDEFICGKCAKTDHRDHKWCTIPTAASERRRGLLNFLRKIKEEDLPKIDEKILKMSKQITQNEELCETEIKKLQRHCDEIITRVSEMKKRNEHRLSDNLKGKNEKLKSMKSELIKKKKSVTETVQFIKDNKCTMSDYGLLVNHRELTHLLSDLDVDINKFKHSVKYSHGEINEKVLEKVIGKTLNLDDMNLTETSLFKYEDQRIFVLRTLCEDLCYVRQHESPHTDQLSVTIRILSTVISTDPLEPGGICQSVDGGLLFTLIDESGDYELEAHSRRLVRHITVTGDVIHEYEYQEDGQTRLFTLPLRVIQNRNGDICVANCTSPTTGELVITSTSGHLNSVYRGQNLTGNFIPADVVCDSQCNILVSDRANKNIHLLSPGGEFLKFLLSENEVNGPARLSLYNSTLWVGYYDGLVKVCQYRL
ncbi:uncharacterized protein LOC134266413 [Saccostrea cucullata]|uniref:uncharacterized protein LOC134266413 n=1 Tax=Saccostrea cuccullata TaxID=36930 RepID=UPI002ED307CC